jgi:hypothetical protein
LINHVGTTSISDELTPTSVTSLRLCRSTLLPVSSFGRKLDAPYFGTLKHYLSKSGRDDRAPEQADRKVVEFHLGFKPCRGQKPTSHPVGF